MQQRLTVIDILIILLVSEVYFSMYNHQWFIELFSPIITINSKSNIVFIIPLFYIYVIYQLIISRKKNITWIKMEVNMKLFSLILLYLVMGVSVVIMHEENFDAIKRYLIYLFTPIMVFLSILGLYRKMNTLRRTLHVFFIIGIIFSLYSTILHIKLWYGSEEDISAVAAMFGSQAYEREYAERFTIPGMPPNMLQSALAPLILTGFYFIRNSYGRLRYCYMGATFFLFYSIIITASIGALLSCGAGMVYLIRKKWFRFNKKTLFVVLALILVVFIGGELLKTRVEMVYLVLGRVLGGETTENMAFSASRLVSLIDSFTFHIIPNPIFGSGFSYFIAAQEESLGGRGEHNLYVRLLAQGGLAIFVPFTLILFYLNSIGSRMLKRVVFTDTSSRDLGILLNAGLIVYIIDLNFSPGFFHYYWIWFGFLAAWARNCEMEYRAKSKTL